MAGVPTCTRTRELLSSSLCTPASPLRHTGNRGHSGSTSPDGAAEAPATTCQPHADGTGDVDGDGLGAGEVDGDGLGAGEVDGDGLGAGEVDGDGLGFGDGDTVGDAEVVAVGDADGSGDLDGDGDGEVLLPGDGVPGEVRVSITGTMTAGTTPGKALGDDDALEGDTDGDVGGDEAGPAAGVPRVAATLGWAAGGCLAAADRAKLTAADAARTLTATPVATSGRHQRRRDIWSRPGDRAGRNQGRPEAARPGPGPGASCGQAERTAAAT